MPLTPNLGLDLSVLAFGSTANNLIRKNIEQIDDSPGGPFAFDYGLKGQRFYGRSLRALDLVFKNFKTIEAFSGGELTIERLGPVGVRAYDDLNALFTKIKEAVENSSISFTVTPSLIEPGTEFTINVSLSSGATLTDVAATLDGTAVTLGGTGNTRTGTVSESASAGAALVITVTGLDADENEVTRTRNIQVQAVPVQAPVNTVAPSISGVTTVGETLTGDDGAWEGATTLTRQWLRGSTAISGATGTTYVQTNDELGATIFYRVIGTNSADSTPATSSGVGPVTAVPISPPVAAGTIADQDWTVGTAVNLNVASDFTGTGITYALAPSSSALPAGLALSSAGVISGTPTAAATGTIIVRGTNGGGNDDSAFGFEVNEDAPSITTNAIVSNRGFWLNTSTTRSVGATGVMRRGRFVTDQGDVTNLRTVDAGWIVGPGDAVVALPNSVTFGRYIEYPAGTRHPVTFGGAATGTLVNGAVLVSDVVLNVATGEPLVIPAGAVYWEINTNPTGATQVYPIWTTESGVGYQMLVGGLPLDAYSTNIATHGTSTNATNNFSSIFVTGDILAPGAESAVIAGDSLATGWNDQTTSSDRGEKGMARIPDALGWGYFNASSRGGSPAGYVSTLAPLVAQVFAACDAEPSHVIIETATNALGAVGQTAATMLASREQIRSAFAAMVPDISFIDTTVTTSSTSTDNWATVENQTVSGGTGRIAMVSEFNTGIRNLGVSGDTVVWDVADIVMTSRDSCKWLPLYPASDGLHITSAGHADIAARIAA